MELRAQKTDEGGEEVEREVIVTTKGDLTKEERRSFAKDHPGYRLCFRLRYPNLPLVISIIALLISIGKIILEETI